MKNLTLYFFLLIIVISSSSCERDVPPELLVTVVDSNNIPQENKLVRISVPGITSGVINNRVDGRRRTDLFGKALFRLSNTAIVRVSLLNRINDTSAIDSTDVLLETKHQREDINRIERTLIFR